MTTAKIDDNREKNAIVTDTDGNIANLLVDPVTDFLLIDVVQEVEESRILNTQKIDENRERVSEVVDDNGVIRPLLIDNRNGFLLIDLECC